MSDLAEVLGGNAGVPSIVKVVVVNLSSEELLALGLEPLIEASSRVTTAASVTAIVTAIVTTIITTIITTTTTTAAAAAAASRAGKTLVVPFTVTKVSIPWSLRGRIQGCLLLNLTA